MTAAINTKPRIGALRTLPRPIDAEEIPVGTRVKVPTGAIAIVTGYRGYRREHRVRLVCRYERPRNIKFAVFQILPELVEVLK